MRGSTVGEVVGEKLWSGLIEGVVMKGQRVRKTQHT